MSLSISTNWSRVRTGMAQYNIATILLEVKIIQAYVLHFTMCFVWMKFVRFCKQKYEQVQYYVLTLTAWITTKYY